MLSTLTSPSFAFRATLGKQTNALCHQVRLCRLWQGERRVPGSSAPLCTAYRESCLYTSPTNPRKRPQVSPSTQGKSLPRKETSVLLLPRLILRGFCPSIYNRKLKRAQTLLEEKQSIGKISIRKNCLTNCYFM